MSNVTSVRPTQLILDPCLKGIFLRGSSSISFTSIFIQLPKVRLEETEKKIPDRMIVIHSDFLASLKLKLHITFSLKIFFVKNNLSDEKNLEKSGLVVSELVVGSGEQDKNYCNL